MIGIARLGLMAIALAIASAACAGGVPGGEVGVANMESETRLSAVPSPSADPSAPTAAPVPAPGPEDLPVQVGVQVFEVDVETDAIARIADAGATLARTRALWKLIEPEPGRYDWTVTDRLFGDVTAAGLDNLAAVYANPPWAAETECGPVAEAHMDAYAALWTALVERYDGDGVDDAPNGARVRAWQVSNEVDFAPSAAEGEGDYGGCFGDDPAAYARHYRRAREAARAADPEARVGFGPVAWDRFAEGPVPPEWQGPAGPYAYDFTREALSALVSQPGEGAPDFIGLHHYPDQAHAWDALDGEGRQELPARAAAFRARQLAPVDPGLASLPIVLSETGQGAWPSDEWTERSEALQAVYAARAVVRAAAAGVEGVVWYTARDDLLGDCAPPHWDWMAFGLMRSPARDAALAERCPELAAEAAAAGAAETGGATTLAEDDGDGAPPRPALGSLAATIDALRGSRYLRPALTDRPGVEAYLFRRHDRRDLLALWTSTGQRLGARAATPVTVSLRLDETLLSPWTGQVEVLGHDGARRVLGAAGQQSVELELGQAPFFLRPLAADTPPEDLP